MAFIFYMSSHPSPDELRIIPIIGQLKLVHIVEYGMLYVLFWLAITKTTAYNITEKLLLALTMTVLYGLTDEFHQIFIPGRTARLIDAFANGVGAVLAESIRTLLARFTRSAIQPLN